MGAYLSEVVYIFKCIPTIELQNSILVSDALDLPLDETNFTVQFCVHVMPAKLWPHIEMGETFTCLQKHDIFSPFLDSLAKGGKRRDGINIFNHVELILFTNTSSPMSTKYKTTISLFYLK